MCLVNVFTDKIRFSLPAVCFVLTVAFTVKRIFKIILPSVLILVFIENKMFSLLQYVRVLVSQERVCKANFKMCRF